MSSGLCHACNSTGVCQKCKGVGSYDAGRMSGLDVECDCWFPDWENKESKKGKCPYCNGTGWEIKND